jgi:hypothetical protein
MDSVENLIIKSGKDEKKIAELTAQLDAANKALAEINENRIGELKSDIMQRSSFTDELLKGKTVAELQLIKTSLDSVEAVAKAASVKAVVDGRKVTENLSVGRWNEQTKRYEV